VLAARWQYIDNMLQQYTINVIAMTNVLTMANLHAISTTIQSIFYQRALPMRYQNPNTFYQWLGENGRTGHFGPFLDNIVPIWPNVLIIANLHQFNMVGMWLDNEWFEDVCISKSISRKLILFEIYTIFHHVEYYTCAMYNFFTQKCIDWPLPPILTQPQV